MQRKSPKRSFKGVDLGGSETKLSPQRDATTQARDEAPFRCGCTNVSSQNFLTTWKLYRQLCELSERPPPAHLSARRQKQA